jgi:hypothetical protein
MQKNLTVERLFREYTRHAALRRPDECAAFYAGFAACLMAIKMFSDSSLSDREVIRRGDAMFTECEDIALDYINFIARPPGRPANPAGGPLLGGCRP